MATISLLSAKGSPGVTTTTVALTMAWSGVHPGRCALAVDADPIGGDTAAGVLRGAVPTSAGILPLATARGVDAHEALDSACVHLRSDGSARVLPGVPDGARAAALPLAWDVLADLRADLHHAGTDVLVDAGRVERAGLAAVDAAWLADSDLAVLLVRPSLPAVMAAHRFVADWPLAGVPLHLLVVSSESPYGPAEVGEAVGAPLLGVVAFDPASARVHFEGANPARGFERSQYARSLRRVAGDLGELAIARADLQLPAPALGDAVASPLAIEVHA
jgi:MinD-like ATPase involved in chromosome partitioning or flagellar assembly